MAAAAGLDAPLRLGMVAGEASGDALGAALIEALRARAPSLTVEGVAGPGMRAAGCAPLAGIAELSVMGLAEVVRHLPRLVRLRRRLARHFLGRRPDVFVGIDAPDFNLGLEARLRAGGIRTAHYVSPTVWAWRRGRVRTIARAVDRMLTLFPFETAVYREAGVDVRCVGHPLAAMLPRVDDPGPSRAALGLPAGGTVVALLPGSRPGEWTRHGGLFVAAAQRLAMRVGAVTALVPLARSDARPVLEAARARAPELDCRLLDGRAHLAMAAADVVLAASGTATLEAALIGRPMVVAYRLAPLTHVLARRLVRTPFVALPNLLAGRALVPEFIQDAAQPDALAAALAAVLEPARAGAVRAELATLRARLGGEDPAAAAAQAVLELAAARAA